MTGGLMQLVAIGQEDLFLTYKPQITFFKIVYRRHTNFSIEQIPQYFTGEIDFGQKISCTVSRDGDLVGKMYLVITLPNVKKFSNSTTLFAWARRIGFVIIKSVEVLINGRQIDKHYGEWLNLWAELTGAFSSSHKDGFNKMIGDIPELTEFTNGKNEYTLYIPLYFWFCKIGRAHV